MPASYPAVTHVIFDVDGLLLDTERLYTEATQRIADRFGKRFTWEVKERQMGRRMREVGEIVVQSLELPISVEEYTVEAQALWQQLFPTAALMPGALRLVHHLHEHGVPMALASGGGEPAFRAGASLAATAPCNAPRAAARPDAKDQGGGRDGQSGGGRFCRGPAG